MIFDHYFQNFSILINFKNNSIYSFNFYFLISYFYYLKLILLLYEEEIN